MGSQRGGKAVGSSRGRGGHGKGGKGLTSVSSSTLESSDGTQRTQCPMLRCSEKTFEETWQLEQHCFDRHGQTHAQLLATSLNHDLEIQERRECPTCETKFNAFWQLVKHCDEAHQSTVKDLLPRVRGLLEGVTVDDVKAAPLCAKARMTLSDAPGECRRQKVRELTEEVLFRRQRVTVRSPG
eukprot:Rhum_TRINITY_DN14740_c6_g1::Rhum_TRINITY_DN14740_c6_g1_i5::g.114472::m.114472